MNNLLRIMALEEDMLQRVVFVRAREEGGIGYVYDPERQAHAYEVFIHRRLPFRTVSSWEFPTWAEARSFAARTFQKDWELLEWDMRVKRPCEEGGKECGSGSCDVCASGGGCGENGASGCSSHS